MGSLTEEQYKSGSCFQTGFVKGSSSSCVDSLRPGSLLAVILLSANNNNNNNNNNMRSHNNNNHKFIII